MATDINVQAAQENGANPTRTGQWFRPPVDILEKADELLLVADLPGANRDSIDIHFEDGILTITGKVAGRYDEKTNFLWREYGVGGFHRSFRVNEQFDANRIHAEYADGVLTIHLPKAEAAKPRKIEVQAAG